MSDQDLYEKIGQLLINAGPDGACEIIVRAELFDENDGGRYEFDYVGVTGEVHWFEPDGRAVRDLTELLVKLRKYFLSSNLVGGKVWTRCVINLVVKSNKLAVKFFYENGEIFRST
ncbi:hypothetical protein XarbCFBP7604_09190 [Xanthomonas arboricola]|uniref:hypothetical protein n=1 Tax=Xanthomonas arboricola TaxID=56448 RepID=UPI000CEEC5DF|nr:hypothetical protein [Xanthomonas arboricola]PPU34026.1 hypothetical protein XarbCFBP7604_09190 [Xanthomonas arboricola]